MIKSSFLEYYPNAGGIRIENRDGVIWVSLTDISRASGNSFWKWKELESTKKFLNSLGYDRGFKLFETIDNGKTSERGTWAIEEVAIEFANWCYPNSKNCVFSEGLFSIRKTGSYSLPQHPQLPSEEKAVRVAKAVAEIQTLLSEDHPRLAQFLIDYAISDVNYSQQS